MKKTTLLFLGIALSFAACKKSGVEEAAPTSSNNTSSSIGAVPATFTQKVLIEEFTGTWCGYCPDGALKLDAVLNAHPGLVYGASIHDGDPMAISLNTYISNAFNVSSWPSAMINRVPASGATKAPMSRSLWASNTNLRLADIAKCGLAVKSSISSSDTVSVEVHAGFKESMTGTYNMVVYVTEDSVHGTGGQWPQHNYDNTTPGSPLFGLGDPITGTWYHQNVVRQVLTSNAGDVITAANITPGGQQVKTFKFARGTWNKNNLYILAFILKNGSTGLTYQVMNVQKVKVGSTKNWD